jgi:MFS family permease
MENSVKIQLGIITSLSIANGIFISVSYIQHITTYSSRLVVDLGITQSRTEAGFYAGAISSSFMLGRALGSFYWGNFIDKHGRKKGIMISLANLAIFSLILGFCKNYYLLLLYRFIAGFFAPIPAICKTIVSEVCVGENLAKGMATLVSGWYISLIIGNFVGGQFSHPEELGIVTKQIRTFKI